MMGRMGAPSSEVDSVLPIKMVEDETSVESNTSITAIRTIKSGLHDVAGSSRS